MLRTLYLVSVVTLLAGTAWTAAGAETGGARGSAGLGLVILAALQR
jgi:hypothetical protein